MIDIKSTSNTTRFSTPINEGSKRKYTLMKEDYITLKFSVENPIYFKLGDYVDESFGLFELVDLCKPAINETTGGYDYELRLDAYYWKWKNKIFKFRPETGGQEAAWNLTATLDIQMGVFLRNLQALGYKYKNQNFEFSIDNTVENKSVSMSYDKTNLLDTLTRFAESWECEWWITESVIHFGRCEHGDAIDFELGKNVETMTRSDSKTNFATRVYAFGSTRNIPINYRPIDENVVVNGIVQQRLMLPVGTPHIDAYPNMPIEEAVEDVVVFEDVYPRRIGSVSNITTHSYTDVIKEEGKPDVVKKWDAYRFKDSGIIFSEKYVLKSQELKIVFQSGALNGMEFAVTFNPCDKEGGETPIPDRLPDGSCNPSAQVWEIVRNEDYGRPLPDDVLRPQEEHLEGDKLVPADTYILSGFDPAFVSVSMIPDAEKELKAKAEKYVEKSKIDPSTYENKMMSGYMVDGNGNSKLLEVGDKVNLINEAYFDTGNRQSRIIGFEYNLDIPWDSPVYTVGETASYSRIGDLESKVDSLTYKGQSYTGTGGSGVYLIRSNDSTPVSDSNVFSAKRALKEFLSKTRPEETEYLFKALGGLIAKGGIDTDSIIIRSDLNARQLKSRMSQALTEEGDSEVIGLDLIEEGDRDEDMMSLSLIEEEAAGGVDASTLGELTNVDKTADDAPDGAVLVSENKTWLPKFEAFLNTGVAGDGTEIKTFDALMAYIGQLAPAGVQRTLRVNNNLDSKNVSASKGEPCPLSFTFTSQQRNSMSEPYEDTGERGLCQISIKNTDNADFTVVKQLWITSGFPYSFDCAEYLTSGANNIMIKVTGEITEETTPAFVYTVQLTSLSLAANNFKWWTAYTGDITMPFNIGGNVNKILYVTVTGTGYKESYTVPVGTGIYTETAYNYVVKHSGRTGVYNISAYVTNSDGTIRTRTISFNVICAVLGAQTKLLVINNTIEKATNWSENNLFDYAMYDGDNVNTAAEFRITKDGIKVFGSEENAITTSTKHSFSFPMEIDTIDNSEFTILVSVASGSQQLITPITIPVNNKAGYSAVAGATFYLNPRTRSNRQSNHLSIVNEMNGEELPGTWENMTWGNDGWTTDVDSNNVLRLMAGSLLTIPHQTFSKECARTGKTIEFDYKVDNVTDYSEPLITIASPSGDSFIGLCIYADDIIMHTSALKNTTLQSIGTDTGVRIRMSLVILPTAYGNAGFNLCYIYINGKKVRSFTYANNDYFAQNGNIVVGSDYADVDLYGLRIYENGLTSSAILQNYINWLIDNNEKMSVKLANDILDSNGAEIEYENTKDQYNVFTFDNEFPSFLNPGNRTGTIELFFVDNPERNVKVTNVAASGQGTSSKKYLEWNEKFKLDKTKSIVTYADGTTATKKFKMFDGVPACASATAKKNWASSMQDHKCGSVNAYTDVAKKCGLTNEAIIADNEVRLSVAQKPFIGFQKSINEEGETIYTCKGEFTFGPDKGDKYCFGYDEEKFPKLISIEGSDNAPLPALFRVPWITGRMVYNADEEAWQYNGTNSFDFGAGLEENIKYWIPAYNCVYQCSGRILPFNGTIAELNARVAEYKNSGYEYWTNDYNLYYFEAAEGKFIASDIGSGGINLVAQLVDKGYGLTTDDLTGKTKEQFNALFVAAREKKFVIDAPVYWDVDDTLFHDNWVELFAGTDQRAKNTYPYYFGSKWKWRIDDADTIGPVDNQGQLTKGYSIEVHDKTSIGAAIWNGETSVLHNLFETAFAARKVEMMRIMLSAMATLGGLASGTEFDKLYAFYRKYFLSVKEYFPHNAVNADAKRYELAKLAYISGAYTNDTDPITQSLGDGYSTETAWFKKRFLYIMSKYSFGTFSADGTDTIIVRAAGDTIQYEITPAIDMYPAVANGTSIVRGNRTKAGEKCIMNIELGGSGDQQNAIQCASYLQDIGEWYNKNVRGTMTIKGRMLRYIRLGSKTETIVISISALTIADCTSLQELVLSRIATLSGSLNLSGCSHLRKVYADGTSLTQIQLPRGGALSHVEFSAYNQYLTLQNYPLLTNEGVGIDLCKGIITDFFVVDCPLMQPMQLLVGIMDAQKKQGIAHALKRIRVVGFDETYYTSEMLDKLAELTNGSYEGLSSDGLAGEDAIPVLDGKLTVIANAHEDAVNMLKETFKKLLLTVVGKMYASFKDSLVEEIVSKKWGDGVGITNAEVTNVTNVSYVFRKTNITSFDEFEKFTNAIPGVEDRAFRDCAMLKSVSLPEQYKDSNNYVMFGGCISLEFVKMPDSFTAISGLMFESCKSLKRISLPSSLLRIGADSFFKSGLETITIPNGVESIDSGAFNQCSNLEIATLGENIKAIGMNCFENCLKMKTIILKTKAPPTYNYNAMGWNNTSSIYVPDESLDAYKSASGWSGIKARLKPMSEYTAL